MIEFAISGTSLSDARQSCDLFGRRARNPGGSAGWDDPEKNRSSYASCSSARSSSYRALPGFSDVPRSERLALFLKKLELCCVVFDFAEAARNAKEKKIKRQTLEELVDYVGTSGTRFTEAVIQEAVKMVSWNLFRELNPLHRKKMPQSSDLEVEDHYMDPSWPHLELVYQFFLKILESRELDVRLASRFIDGPFIVRLLDLFNSEDPREREFSKAILHRVYSKFSKLRPFIKREIENILFEFLYETEKHNGIAELLEILGIVITGFVLPLKEEHKQFLVKILIPLHKTRSIGLYHDQLCFCITQFIDKDPRLAEIVVKGLLKYWPVTHSWKQVIFLRELEEILEATSLTVLDGCVVPLCRRMARCLDNPHYQVVERVLVLWNNYHISRLMEGKMGAILPILYPSLERSARDHWNKTIQKSSQSALRVFSRKNKTLVGECKLIVEKEKVREEMAKSRREQAWKYLEEIADCHTSTCNQVV